MPGSSEVRTDHHMIGGDCVRGGWDRATQNGRDLGDWGSRGLTGTHRDRSAAV